MNLHQEETINAYRNLVAEIRSAIDRDTTVLQTVSEIIILISHFKEPAPINSITDNNPQPTSPLDE